MENERPSRSLEYPRGNSDSRNGGHLEAFSLCVLLLLTSCSWYSAVGGVMTEYPADASNRFSKSNKSCSAKDSDSVGEPAGGEDLSNARTANGPLHAQPAGMGSRLMFSRSSRRLSICELLTVAHVIMVSFCLSCSISRASVVLQVPRTEREPTSLTCVETAPSTPRLITVVTGESVFRAIKSITRGHP